MQLFTPEYNKKNNMFEQGVSRIRNRNNNFFENTDTKNTLQDLKDIKSYFVVDTMGEMPSIEFKKNYALPPKIESDLRDLFNDVFMTVK